MRIRKNAAIPVLSFLETSIAPPCGRSPSVETHLCELNRSPWDVISFAPQSCPDEYQVEINDCVMGNAIGVESVNAVDSITVASLKEEKFKEEDNEEEERRFSLLADVDHKAKRNKKKIGSKRGKESKGYVCCNKTDGKGWQCRREAKQGHSLCEHHLTQLRSYHYNNTHSGFKSDHIKPVSSVNSRRRNKTKSSSSSSSSVANPSEFYYYSGFGPLWGKKRSGTVTAFASTSSSSRAHDHGDSSIVHDNEDDDDEEDTSGEADAPKKRLRKPIKARSLKSLL